MSTPPLPTVAITGASGYVGGVLRARCAERGWPIVSLVRSPTGEGARRYTLDEPPDADLLAGVDVLIHCAYDLSVVRPPDIWRVNVGGTRALLELARRSGVTRTIVVSSMSAYAGTLQLYGQAKLDVEAHARGAGAIAVRPGLVYGPDAGGMAGALTALTRLPLVPVVAARSHQFTVHQDDLADAMEGLALAPDVPADPVGLANPQPVAFREIIEGLARMSGRRCRTIPVGWRFLHAGLRLCERAGVPVPFRSDSLLGLVHPAPAVPNLEVLDALSVSLRRFGEPVPEIPRR